MILGKYFSSILYQILLFKHVGINNVTLNPVSISKQILLEMLLHCQHIFTRIILKINICNAIVKKDIQFNEKGIAHILETTNKDISRCNKYYAWILDTVGNI